MVNDIREFISYHSYEDFEFESSEKNVYTFFSGRSYFCIENRECYIAFVDPDSNLMEFKVYTPKEFNEYFNLN